jgi:hypothetical protein
MGPNNTLLGSNHNYLLLYSCLKVVSNRTIQLKITKWVPHNCHLHSVSCNNLCHIFQQICYGPSLTQNQRFLNALNQCTGRVSFRTQIFSWHVFHHCSDDSRSLGSQILQFLRSSIRGHLGRICNVRNERLFCTHHMAHQSVAATRAP